MSTPKYVHELSDGRPFITDVSVRLEPRLVEILRLDQPANNYWQRHEYLDGWVGVKDDDHG